MSSDAPKKLPLSVVLISHNAERHLPLCLRSIQDIASEIVVVHNDCTDNTVKIAREFGAKTIEQKWLGFRDQKNLVMDHATQPWILSLDSDEEVSSELLQLIVEFIKADDPKYNGAHFPRKVWFLGRWITHGDWYPDYSLRLIRQGKGRWGGGNVHEKIKLEGKSKRLTGDLHHYCNPNMNSHLSRLVYYSDLFLENRLEEGKRWSATGTVIRSVWRFFRAYIFRLGFLDGYAGLYIAWFDSFSSFYRHSRMYEHMYHTEFPKEHVKPHPLF